jgi:hypothetical protein
MNVQACDANDVLDISLPVVSDCQARFCNSFEMATCLQQIFAGATELHEGEITMPSMGGTTGGMGDIYPPLLELGGT